MAVIRSDGQLAHFIGEDMVDWEGKGHTSIVHRGFRLKGDGGADRQRLIPICFSSKAHWQTIKSAACKMYELMTVRLVLFDFA